LAFEIRDLLPGVGDLLGLLLNLFPESFILSSQPLDLVRVGR
jgi:hypothetical protein